jgi:hypothetical protein
MRLPTVALLLALAVGLAVAEDTLILKDGQVITGQIVSQDRRDVRIRTGDETRRVPRSVIETILSEGERLEPIATNKPFRTSPDATPELASWVDLCIRHLDSDDAGVRSGAEAALRAAGPAARAAIELVVAERGMESPPAAIRLLTHLDSLAARAEKRPQDDAGSVGWDRVDMLVRGLALRGDQVPAFRSVVRGFFDGVTELTESVRAGEIEQADADQKFSELRAAVAEGLADVLSEEQVKRCLGMLPQRGPRAPRP